MKRYLFLLSVVVLMSCSTVVRNGYYQTVRYKPHKTVALKFNKKHNTRDKEVKFNNKKRIDDSLISATPFPVSVIKVDANYHTYPGENKEPNLFNKRSTKVFVKERETTITESKVTSGLTEQHSAARLKTNRPGTMHAAKRVAEKTFRSPGNNHEEINSAFVIGSILLVLGILGIVAGAPGIATLIFFLATIWFIISWATDYTNSSSSILKDIVLLILSIIGLIAAISTSLNNISINVSF